MSAIAENTTDLAPPLLDARDGIAQLPGVRMLGLPIHRVTIGDAVDHIMQCLARRIGGWVMTPNVDILRRWVRSREFRDTTSPVTMCIPDGMPLVWASRLAGDRLPQRITGADLSRALIAAAARRRASVFFLGGAPQAAENAMREMQRAHPALHVAGTYFPPYGFEQDVVQWDTMSAVLAAAQPDIVFVGLGSPKQENVIGRLRPLLPHAWWLGVGVTFSFLSRQISRAPRWMQRGGLEWLHRLACEPRRLAKRYLVDDLPFACWLLARAARGKLAVPLHPYDSASASAASLRSRGVASEETT